MHEVLKQEVDALKEIYLEELAVTTDNNVCELRFNLSPATGEKVNEKWVSIVLCIRPTLMYPLSTPKMNILNPRGLLEEHTNSIIQSLTDVAKKKLGYQMIFELVELAKEILTKLNIPHVQCMICLEDLSTSSSQTFVKTVCLHYFHRNCLARYVQFLLSSNHNSSSNDSREASAIIATVNATSIKATTSAVASVSFASGPNFICPICRGEIGDSCNLLDADDGDKSDGEDFKYVPDVSMIQLQVKMREIIELQRAKGGIIDEEVEKRKYDLPKDFVYRGLKEKEELERQRQLNLEVVDHRSNPTTARDIPQQPTSSGSKKSGHSVNSGRTARRNNSSYNRENWQKHGDDSGKGNRITRNNVRESVIKDKDLYGGRISKNDGVKTTNYGEKNGREVENEVAGEGNETDDAGDYGNNNRTASKRGNEIKLGNDSARSRNWNVDGVGEDANKSSSFYADHCGDLTYNEVAENEDVTKGNYESESKVGNDEIESKGADGSEGRKDYENCDNNRVSNENEIKVNKQNESKGNRESESKSNNESKIKDDIEIKKEIKANTENVNKDNNQNEIKYYYNERESKVRNKNVDKIDGENVGNNKAYKGDDGGRNYYNHRKNRTSIDDRISNNYPSNDGDDGQAGGERYDRRSYNNRNNLRYIDNGNNGRFGGIKNDGWSDGRNNTEHDRFNNKNGQSSDDRKVKSCDNHDGRISNSDQNSRVDERNYRQSYDNRNNRFNDRVNKRQSSDDDQNVHPSNKNENRKILHNNRINYQSAVGNRNKQVRNANKKPNNLNSQVDRGSNESSRGIPMKTIIKKMTDDAAYKR